MNLMMLLEMAVTGFGDRVAVKSSADTLGYRELMTASSAVAEQLQAASSYTKTISADGTKPLCGM